MKTWLRWVLGGRPVLNLAAWSPDGSAGDRDEGSAAEQNDGGDDD